MSSTPKSSEVHYTPSPSHEQNNSSIHSSAAAALSTSTVRIEDLDVSPSSPTTQREVQPRVGVDKYRRIQLYGYNIPILTGPIVTFGFFPVCTIVLTYFTTKGIFHAVAETIPYELFIIEFGQDSLRLNRYSTACRAGYSLKPAYALIINYVPLFGYRRRWWFVIASSCMMLCLLFLFFIIAFSDQIDDTTGSVVTTVLMFMTRGFGAIIDTVTEATWTHLIIFRKNQSVNLVTLAWLASMLGNTIGSSFVGPMGDHDLTQYIFLILLPVACAPILPGLRNWPGELRLSTRHGGIREEPQPEFQQKVEEEEGRSEERELSPDVWGDDSIEEREETRPIQEEDELSVETTIEEVTIPTTKTAIYIQRGLQFITPAPMLRFFDAGYLGITVALVRFSIVLSLVTVSGVIVTIASDKALVNLLVVGIPAILVMLLGFLSLPTMIAACNAYLFCKISSYFLIEGAMNLFFLAQNLDNGPHFKKTFYQTVGQIVASVAGFFGVLLFGLFFGKRSWRLTFYLTMTLRIVASAFDILITTRKNLDIHLSDKFVFLLGDAVIYQMTYQIDFMPGTILITRLCPRNREVLMYATLAGASNMGQTVAGIFGTYLLEAFGINGVDQPGGFSNVDRLPWAIGIGHLIIPTLIMFPLTYLLIPAGRMDDTDYEGLSTYDRKTY